MRWHEIFGGLRMMLPLEQDSLYMKIKEAKRICNEDLEESELELAYKMLSNGSLDYHREDNKTYFTASTPDQDIWRD